MSPSPITEHAQTDVYLVGDPVAISTTLTVDQIISKLVEIHEIARDVHEPLCFLRLPLPDNDQPAMVRPTAISALVPSDDED